MPRPPAGPVICCSKLIYPASRLPHYASRHESSKPWRVVVTLSASTRITSRCGGRLRTASRAHGSREGLRQVVAPGKNGEMPTKVGLGGTLGGLDRHS